MSVSYKFIILWFHYLDIQWYKICRNPEGTRSSEINDYIDAANCHKVVTNGTDENYYKSRIRSLNEEIIALNKKNKALNDELAMVCLLINTVCI